MRIRCPIVLLMLFTVTQAHARPPSDSDWDHSYYLGGGTGSLITWDRGHEQMGLWNLTTLVGLAIVLHRRRNLPPFQQLWRRRLYLFSFTAAFMLINCSADWMLVLAMAKYWPMGPGPLWPWFGIGG